MIEMTVKYIEDVEFLDRIKILEPDGYIHGVPIYYVHHNFKTPQVMEAIKLLGLKYLDYDFIRDVDRYTTTKLKAWLYKSIAILLRVHWKFTSWLYDNARMFKQIPPGEPFNWKYFIAYVWFTNTKLWLLKNVKTNKGGSQ